MSTPSKTALISAAVIVSIILYLAGVFSGLYASKLYEQRTQSSLQALKSETRQDLDVLRQGTEEQITHLNSYIGFLENNLITIQLEQAFLSTLSDRERCEFSQRPPDHLVDELQEYRDRLPYRIEQYERDNVPSQEYRTLKEEYNMLSLKAWVLLRQQYRGCTERPVLVLYLYDRECEECVRQGEQLDIFTYALDRLGRDVMLFTVDADADDSVLDMIRSHYQVNETPAIIVNDRVRQGKLYTADELLEAVR